MPQTIRLDGTFVLHLSKDALSPDKALLSEFSHSAQGYQQSATFLCGSTCSRSGAILISGDAEQLIGKYHKQN